MGDAFVLLLAAKRVLLQVMHMKPVKDKYQYEREMGEEKVEGYDPSRVDLVVMDPVHEEGLQGFRFHG